MIASKSEAGPVPQLRLSLASSRTDNSVASSAVRAKSVSTLQNHSSSPLPAATHRQAQASVTRPTTAAVASAGSNHRAFFLAAATGIVHCQPATASWQWLQA
jgi:hypothetical protein